MCIETHLTGTAVCFQNVAFSVLYAVTMQEFLIQITNVSYNS